MRYMRGTFINIIIYNCIFLHKNSASFLINLLGIQLHGTINLISVK